MYFLLTADIAEAKDRQTSSHSILQGQLVLLILILVLTTWISPSKGEHRLQHIRCLSISSVLLCLL